jgi:CubicO group peptidase (beta-lactamase class C family)
MKNAAITTFSFLLAAVLSYPSAHAEDNEKIPFPNVFKRHLESTADSTRFSVPENAKCKGNVGRDFTSASPTDVGISASGLKRLNDALDTGSYDIRSLLVVRDCRLIFERYKEGIGREHNHTIYSVTKSVTATLVGALLMQGKLKSLDARVSDVIAKPWWIRDSDWEKAKRISLKNAMQMSSGLAYEHHPTNNSIYSSADRFASALSPDLEVQPGTRFKYSDGDVSVTGAMVAAAANKDLYLAAEVAPEI